MIRIIDSYFIFDLYKDLDDEKEDGIVWVYEGQKNGIDVWSGIPSIDSINYITKK